MIVSKHPHGHLSFQLWTQPVTLLWVPFQSPLHSKPRRLDLCGNIFSLFFSFTAFASLVVVGLWGHLYQWSQTECVLLCVDVSIRCYVFEIQFCNCVWCMLIAVRFLCHSLPSCGCQALVLFAIMATVGGPAMNTQSPPCLWFHCLWFQLPTKAQNY